jgi:non-specific serine/threonine protein kinase
VLNVSETPTSPTTPIERWEVLDLLTSLVQKSLVVYEEDEQGQGRYRLLETVRQYARDGLQEAEEAEAVRERHRDWFLALAERGVTDGSERARLDRLEVEHDNLRAALAWSTARREGEAGLRLGSALAHFWLVRGYVGEGREHLAEVLALPGAHRHTAIRAHVLREAGILARTQANYWVASSLLEESLAIVQELGDRPGFAWTLHNLAEVALDQGDLGTARARWEESLAMFRDLGDKGGIASSFHNLGAVALDQGDYGAARTFSEESLAMWRELGGKGGIAFSLWCLGRDAHARGDYSAARAFLEESLVICREEGDRQGIAANLVHLGTAASDQRDYGAAWGFFREGLAICWELGYKREIVKYLEGFAVMAIGQGQTERAARLFGTAVGLREAMGAPLPPADRAELDRAVAAVRTALGEEAFAAAWAEGRALAPEEAVQYALGDSNA